MCFVIMALHGGVCPQCIRGGAMIFISQNKGGRSSEADLPDSLKEKRLLGEDYEINHKKILSLSWVCCYYYTVKSLIYCGLDI